MGANRLKFGQDLLNVDKQYQVALFLIFGIFFEIWHYFEKNIKKKLNFVKCQHFLQKSCHISRNFPNNRKKLLETVCPHSEMIFTKFQPVSTIFIELLENWYL